MDFRILMNDFKKSHRHTRMIPIRHEPTLYRGEYPRKMGCTGGCASVFQPTLFSQPIQRVPGAMEMPQNIVFYPLLSISFEGVVFSDVLSLSESGACVASEWVTSIGGLFSKMVFSVTITSDTS